MRNYDFDVVAEAIRTFAREPGLDATADFDRGRIARHFAKHLEDVYDGFDPAQFLVDCGVDPRSASVDPHPVVPTVDEEVIKDLPYYHQSIARATGVTDFDDLAEIEDTMRHVIFHSTLDWQDREMFDQGAREAWEVVQLSRKVDRGYLIDDTV